MAVQYLVNTGLRTNLALNTAATMIEVVTAANLPLEWIELDIFNMATTGYTIVSFATYTTTGTGTAATPRRIGQAVGNASHTAKINMTAEGAGVADFFQLAYANPFTDRIMWPLGRETFQNVSSIMGVRFNSSVAGSATAPAGAVAVLEE